ncbi:MAG: SDR family NAD(P)-dependent oxidoreductase [Acidobacteriota bacterium]
MSDPRLDRRGVVSPSEVRGLRQVFSLEGRVALVSGGGTGIGWGVTQCLWAAGARVVVTGRRESVLRAAVESLGERASWFIHDVTDFEASAGLVERIGSELGPIDILVNNAGIHLKKPALETTESELQQVVDVHLTGAFSLTRACLPGMIELGGGSVVFIASMASFLGLPLVLAYSTAKTGVLGMVRSLAAEYSRRGVRFNAVAPGWIHSRMLDQSMEGDPGREEKVLARTMLGRFGNPEDVGWAVVYLCSPAAHYITGACLPVDGGASVGF